MGLGAGAARRLRAAVRRVGIAPTQPGPRGTLDSLAEWVSADGGDESAWLTAPLPAEPGLRQPRTAAPAGIPAFEAALARYETLSDMRANQAEVAVLSDGQIVGSD